MDNPLEKLSKKIAEGTFKIISGNIAGILLAFLLRIVIARYLSKADYGLFSLSIVIINILVTISMLGIEKGVVRQIPYFLAKGENEKATGVVVSSLKIIFLVSFLIMAVYFPLVNKLSSLLHKQELVPLLRIMSILIPLQSIFLVLLSIYRGFENIRVKIFFQNFLLHSLRILFISLAVLFGMSFTAIIWSYVVACITATTLLILFSVKKIYKFSPIKHNINMNREVLIFSIPLFAAGMLGMIVQWTDTLMLGYFTDSAVVALYSAATDSWAAVVAIDTTTTSISRVTCNSEVNNTWTRIITVNTTSTIVFGKVV